MLSRFDQSYWPTSVSTDCHSICSVIQLKPACLTSPITFDLATWSKCHRWTWKPYAKPAAGAVVWADEAIGARSTKKPIRLDAATDRARLCAMRIHTP